MKKLLLALALASSLGGCGFLTDELQKTQQGQSKLEQQVQAAAPVLGPYGALAIAGATLATAIFGAFHAQQANVQTDPKPTATPPTT